MTAEALMRLGQSRHRPHGWVASLLLHGLALSIAMALFSELKPAAQPEPFRWDISLAQVAPPPQPTPPAPVAKPQRVAQTAPPAPVKRMETRPVVQRIQQTVQPVETVQRAVQQMVRHEQEPVQHQAQPVDESLAQHAEPVLQERQTIETAEPVQAKTTTTAEVPTPIPQAIETPMTPVNAPVVAQAPTPVVTQEPVVSQEEIVSRPVAEPIQHAAVDSQPIPSEVAPAQTRESVESVPQIHTVEPVQAPAVQEQMARSSAAQPQVAERPAPITASTKADYSWLAQELLSRLERYKRYPYTARMNRWEGKVVVKAVVREDGQVVSLQIAESSGHAVLDNDAMELIRQVSPIHLKHPLGATQVSLLVPVGYSLR